MTLPHRVPILRAGIDYLARVQLDYGEFPGYRYQEAMPGGARQFDSSPFMTSFIIHSLGFLRDPKAAALRSRALQFLCAEREDPGVWRYWSSRTTATIDPDLDDTCCISHLLRRYVPDSHMERNLATVLANRTEHGVFKTWLRPPSEKNDVDSVVNANVLLYLGERAETVAAIDAVSAAVNSDTEQETYHYYLDPLSLYYMVSRAYSCSTARLGSCREAILAKTQERIRNDFTCGGPLHAALAVCTLHNLDGMLTAEPRNTFEYVSHTQREDGSWPPQMFYRGPEPPAEPSVWWAAEALTTAICLEAFSRTPAGRA